MQVIGRVTYRWVMTVNRAELHRLVDALPDEQVADASQILRAVFLWRVFASGLPQKVMPAGDIRGCVQPGGT